LPCERDGSRGGGELDEGREKERLLMQDMREVKLEKGLIFIKSACIAHSREEGTGKKEIQKCIGKRILLLEKV